MLINALCDYYRELEKQGKVVPEGYSRQSVHYLISLMPEGKIDGIIDWQISENVLQKNGKVKEVPRPRSILLPLRTEKPGIDSNIIEHRPLYIFGLNFDANAFTSQDKTHKAEKSHEAFRKANLDFIEGLDSPIISAYRNFLMNWMPEEQIDNPYLTDLGKAYKNAYFAFCLSGRPDILLHEDPQIRRKWESTRSEEPAEDSVLAQCAVTGKTAPIARIHNKIKGVPGGQASGAVLVGFKNSSGCSYGNEQSYNSNISEAVMVQYTFALNALLADRNHRQSIDDITVIYWATGGDSTEECVDFLNAFLFGSSEKTNPEQTNQMLAGLFDKAREGVVTEKKLLLTERTDENTDFYILGIKPNASRLSVKFFYRRKLGQILTRVAQHQKDMQIGEEVRAIPLWRLKNELKSPKSANEQIDASLLAAIFQSIINGTPYPVALLSTLVMRIRTDRVINVCLKRKIRNYVELVKGGEAGYAILVKADRSLNAKFEEAYDANNLAKGQKGKNPDDVRAARDYMCRNYADVRMFGAVMSTGDNPCGIVRGPVQINFARSVSPINVQDVTITRQARTTDDRMETGSTEMGKKSIIPYALYRAEGYVSAALANRTTGLSEEDLELLWSAIINMFEEDHSAARGKMCMRKLIVFKHDNVLGSAPSHILFEKITITQTSPVPRSIGDYEITIDRDMPEGVELIEKL